MLQDGLYFHMKVGGPRASESTLGATFLIKPPYRERLIKEKEANPVPQKGLFCWAARPDTLQILNWGPRPPGTEAAVGNNTPLTPHHLLPAPLFSKLLCVLTVSKCFRCTNVRRGSQWRWRCCWAPRRFWQLKVSSSNVPHSSPTRRASLAPIV